MKRRTFITTVGVGLLAQAPLIYAARTATTKPASPDDYEPFKKIAHAKGVKIFVDQDAPPAALSVLHLDMEMIRASLDNAIARSVNQPEINLKLQRLRDQGTPVQQVDFVLGTGTYYFPEDVQKAVVQAGTVNAKSDTQCWVCENVCTLVCNCLGNGDQYCRDRCRNVCHKYC